MGAKLEWMKKRAFWMVDTVKTKAQRWMEKPVNGEGIAQFGWNLGYVREVYEVIDVMYYINIQRVNTDLAEKTVT